MAAADLPPGTRGLLNPVNTGRPAASRPGRPWGREPAGNWTGGKLMVGMGGKANTDGGSAGLPTPVERP